MHRWMQSNKDRTEQDRLRNRDRTDQDWLSCAGGFRETGTELTEPKKGQAHRQNFPWTF